ncbi:MAG: aspartate aminotransferase family protein [FCB group bacterium]|nr:aspartate aminotransferase family protein [FCB group bacterium]MBL7027483.1 aspartate aminotransferase family protein [Candidatus Neomarinimicrobiota bacterium]MBL7122096.1 aspartate aminotransferase family protein [Candidatus Neomarinimicrobiota bacterium]
MDKQSVIKSFETHVSAGKAAFFKKYGMDFVMGNRDGAWIHDMDGSKRLFNCHSNGGVFNLGHRNQEIIDTLKSALDELDIGNHHFMSQERTALAQQITATMPDDLNICIFGVGGGEAVDLALKLACGQPGRSKIISAAGGFHGHTGLALTVGDAQYREPFGINTSNMIQVPFNNAAALAQALDPEVAAVILETVPSTLGMVMPVEGYLQKVRELCDNNGTLLIMDEVQSGLGRTGKLWAFEHAGITPDMVILGKGLSGGIYPIAATVIREPLDAIFKRDPFIHISTYGGSELGCRVAKKVLQISSEPIFLDRVQKAGRKVRAGLDRIQKKYPKFFIGIRQTGLMIGLELRDKYGGPALTKAAYDQDLLMIYANNDTSVTQFLPPLTITDEEIDLVMEKLDSAMNAARKLRTALMAKEKSSGILRRFSGNEA